MKRRLIVGLVVSLTVGLILFQGSALAAAKAPGLWKLLDTFKAAKYIDLTHVWGENTPHWKGFDPAVISTKYNHDQHGFLVHLYTHVGQWGTHVDPPVHFFKGKRTLEDIPCVEMFLPLVVIDCHKQVEANPDYAITMNDIKAWEAKYGPIPQGSFVAMRTDWSKRWPSQEKMMNADSKGVLHYPAWSKEVLEYLYLKQKVTATGHETTDTDGGLRVSKDDYGLEAWILQQNHYQVELLANLDQVPEAGAFVVVSWPKPKGGSGFPARVFAIVP
jgi:kynurenine formamidase